MRPDWLQRLLAGLPGAEPVFRMQPDDDAALGESRNGPDVLLLQRNAHLRHHAGQPAFPGGGVEDIDDGPVGAALREAEEETGLDPAGVEVLTTLPELWIPPTGNLVTPVLAWWREPSDVMPADVDEVASVARVPISALADPVNRLNVRRGSGLVSPAFRVADMLVWGFTGGVLDWLLRLGGWEQPWDRDVIESWPAATAEPAP